MKQTLIVAMTALLLALAACSSDSEPPATTPAIVFDGSGDGTSTVDLCAAIPAASNVAGPCENAQECGDGGLCATPTGASSSECAQACFPDRCGDTCAGGTLCTPLLDDAGGAVSWDVDGDGQAEVIGVCLTPRPGPIGAYGACGDMGACSAGLACIGLDGRDVGTCLPACLDACDVYESFMPSCLPTSAASQVCAIECDPALGAEECPTGMQCVTLAQGAAVCAR